MRKAITMIVVLALGVSLWAESSPTRPSKNDVEIRFPDRRPSDDRTETYELYLVDSYGDGSVSYTHLTLPTICSV